MHLQRILGIQLRHVAPQNVWRPHNRQIFRRHARPLTLKRHSVEMTHQPIHCPATTRMWSRWTLLRDAKTDAAPAYVNVRQFHKSHLGRGNVTKSTISEQVKASYLYYLSQILYLGLGNHELSSVSDSSDDFHLTAITLSSPRMTGTAIALSSVDNSN